MLIMFPGQGSHHVGMAKDFCEHYKVSKDVIMEMDDVLGYHLSDLMFDGPLEDLGETQQSQPAIMSCSYAILQALCYELSESVLFKSIAYAAGHSLGEYSALCAARSIPFARSVELLKSRGVYMSDACAEGGGMLACIGVVDISALESTVANLGPDCFIANDNGAGQVVLSAGKESLASLYAELRKNYKVIPLKVSGPFHCSLMRGASTKMAEVLDGVKFEAPAFPFISNVSVEVLHDGDMIRESLIEQMVSRVRWREIIDFCIAHGVKHYLEIGSDVLGNLLKRVSSDLRIISIKTVGDLHSFIGNSTLVSEFLSAGSQVHIQA